MDSFASKLLKAQRQATDLLAAQIPAAIQQSFLLCDGNFVGVRWQAGDWAITWMANATELVLLRDGVEAARAALEGDLAIPGCGENATLGQSLDPAASRRRAA